MQIIAKCPECNHTWMLKGSAADRRITCRRCGTLFKIPKLDEVSKASEVIKQAKSDIYVDEAGKTFG